MNAFIIGGDGYLGAHITKKFVVQGHVVTVFGPDLKEGLLDPIKDRIVRTEGDMQNPHELFGALLAAKPDIIIHLAAFGAGKDGLTKSANDFPKKALDVNVMGFYNVLEAARLLSVARVVWSSSSVVYGYKGHYRKPYVNEQDALYPATFYGSTKAMNELTARYYRNQYGMDICGLRLPLILGPGKWYKGAAAPITSLFEQSAPNGEATIRGAAGSFDLMYVKDVAELFYHVAMTKNTLSDIYNVNGFNAFLEEIADHVMQMVPEYKVSLQLEPTEAAYPLMDTAKIKSELGFMAKYTGAEACKDYLIELGRLSH